MKVLVTGSAGHLGEALMRSLPALRHDAVGMDLRPSPFTHHVGSIKERGFVASGMRGVDAVLHTATLHKPHIATHSRQDFIDTNVTGTLNLLEEATLAGVNAFVFTSTTSTFGRALIPPGGEPAAWITEGVECLPKNIYGATKLAAEHLCDMWSHERGLPCIVLRTSRFFPEADDDPAAQAAYSDTNLKVNEFLYGRVDVEDAVAAHVLAMQRAPALGFDRFIVSATTPFAPDDMCALRQDAASVVKRYVPAYEAEYARRGWSMTPSMDRVYVNRRAREKLGWQPHYDFDYVMTRLLAAEDYRSPLTRAIGSKAYHGGAAAADPSSN